MSKKYQITSAEIELSDDFIFINWWANIGFGQIRMKLMKNKNAEQIIEFDTEYMSKEFVKSVLNFIVDSNLDE